jgi:hypothetical protein
MKIKVIFKPCCNLAIIGFSEMKLCESCQHLVEVVKGKAHLREDPAADREGHWDDKKHEQCHLRHQEEEDLIKYCQKIEHGESLVPSVYLVERSRAALTRV